MVVSEKDSNINSRILFGPPSANASKDGRGLGFLLNEKFKEYSDKTFQIDAITGKEETFGDYRKKCIRTAIFLKNRGLVPQDKITICTYNNINSAVPLIASCFLGVIPTTLDPSLSVDDIVYLLDLVKPKMMFVGLESLDLIKESLRKAHLDPEIVVFGATPLYIDFEICLSPTNEEDNFEPHYSLCLRDTLMILFSSGTTGLPKGICLSHYYFFRYIESGWFVGNTTLVFSSVYWLTQVGSTFTCIIRGTTKIVYPKFYSNAFWDIIDKYKVTECFLVPHQLQEVCLIGRPKEMTSLTLKRILVAGGPILKKHLQFALDTFYGTKIYNVYGQTEGGVISIYYEDDEHSEMNHEKLIQGSCGQVAPGIVVKVVDPDTEEILAPNMLGEFRITSPYVMNGFYQMDTSTEWDSQSWLKTGDIGYYDEDGYLYVQDRCKEVLKYQMFQISPAYLENIIAEHPTVKQVVVTGLPHEIDGDHPIAFVVPTEGMEVNPEEIREFVDKKVDERKKLRGGVKIIKEIPLTATGKPKRRSLRDMVIDGEL